MHLLFASGLAGSSPPPCLEARLSSSIYKLNENAPAAYLVHSPVPTILVDPAPESKMTMMAYGGWGSSSMAPPPLTLKLQVNTRTNRVVCAEAEKDMADLLFSFGNIPLGAAGTLLGRGSMGSFGNLSQSLGGLHASYVIDQDARDALLAPTGRGLLLLAGSGSSSSSGGFVRGAVTYTVMDDLTVTTMSHISYITMLSSNRRDIGHLQERTVTVGPTEALELLRASLQSRTVLTDVFLRRA